MDDARGGGADGPAERSGAGPVVLVAVLSSVAAGCIQIALGQSNPELRDLRAIFLAEGGAQVLVGLALIVFRARAAAVLVVVVNVLCIISWSITSVVGIDSIEGLEVARGPVLADWVATLLAAVAGLSAVRAARRDGAAHLQARARSNAPAIALTTVAILITVLAISTTEDDDDVDVVAGGLTTTAAPPASTSVAPTTDAPTTTVAPTTSMPPATVGTTVPPGTETWSTGTTEEQVSDVQQLTERTQEAVRDIGSVDDAVAAGYVRIDPAHLVRPAYLLDDLHLDPSAIEALLVAQRDGEDVIVGATYLLDLRSTMDDVPDLGGPLLTWHQHGGACFTRELEVVATGVSPDRCPRGSAFLQDPPMVHIWSDPIVGASGAPRDPATCGTYVFIDLLEGVEVPGCT